MADCKVCGGSGVCGECYGSGKRYDGKACNYCKGTKNARHVEEAARIRIVA